MNVGKEDKIAYKTERFLTLASTNDYAKQQRALGKNLIVVAESQTGGRGTKGRSFSSKKGGVYLSVLTFYPHFPAQQAFEIMQNVAVAVCETLVRYGLQPKIKWPNDIFVNGKKICGILMENTFSGPYISSSVVGVGLNVCNPLDDELLDVATSIERETGVAYEPSKVEEKLVALMQSNLHEKYAQYLGFIGEQVVLVHGETRETARMIGVDKQGNILVETADGVRAFASAEISLLTGAKV